MSATTGNGERCGDYWRQQQDPSAARPARLLCIVAAEYVTPDPTTQCVIAGFDGITTPSGCPKEHHG